MQDKRKDIDWIYWYSQMSNLAPQLLVILHTLGTTSKLLQTNFRTELEWLK